MIRDQENIKIGIERGEGMLAKLIKTLSEDNRSSDIIRITQDKEYRQKLYEEYHIIE